jgi:Laminin G domain
VLFAASASAGVKPAFGAWKTIAVWNMNEGPNASTMHDSSGANRDGDIGSEVLTGVPSGAGVVYEWPADPGVEDPQRLVTVPGAGFNPQRRGFAVTVRFRTSAPDHNIIQKGQATSPGLWKIELDAGRAKCLFKGSSGRGAIGSSGTGLADGNWHTVRCVRRSGRVSITVDGGAPRTIERKTGKIANAAAVSLGGKLTCNPPNGVSCQYYVGQMSRAVVKKRR